ncbi:MAG: hypothetical protein PHW53_05185 [Patescibacteria group bacterium]|nr:hypothetical protein [Patescibacteria group bacterium]
MIYIITKDNKEIGTIDESLKIIKGEEAIKNILQNTKYINGIKEEDAFITNISDIKTINSFLDTAIRMGYDYTEESDAV